MKTYALIDENNEVIETIVVLPGGTMPEFHPSLRLIETAEDIQEGATYNEDSGTFSVDPPTPSAYDIRTHRDDLIKQVRWRIERHKDQKALGLTPVEPVEPLLKYTQALRDVPQQEGFPASVVWPECPPDPTNPKTKLDDSKES